MQFQICSASHDPQFVLAAGRDRWDLDAGRARLALEPTDASAHARKKDGLKSEEREMSSHHPLYLCWGNTEWS